MRTRAARKCTVVCTLWAWLSDPVGRLCAEAEKEKAEETTAVPNATDRWRHLGLRPFQVSRRTPALACASRRRQCGRRPRSRPEVRLIDTGGLEDDELTRNSELLLRMREQVR